MFNMQLKQQQYLCFQLVVNFVCCTLFFCATRTIKISIHLDTVKYPLLDILSKLPSFFFNEQRAPFFRFYLTVLSDLMVGWLL